jgi:hypothetical protein
VSKRAAEEMDMKRFNLKNRNGVEVKEQYQFTIANKDGGLENTPSDTIQEITKISAKKKV